MELQFKNILVPLLFLSSKMIMPFLIILFRTKQKSVIKLGSNKRNIEISDINEQFQYACQQLKNITALQVEQQIQFYGLYKQAIIGDCNKSRPSMFNQAETLKWESWMNFKGMDKQEAMLLYITLIDEYLSDSNQGQQEQQKGSGGFGKGVPTMREEIQEESALNLTTSEKIENFQKAIDAQDLPLIQQILENQLIDLQEFNKQGITPAHYAIDTDNHQSFEIILPFLKNPNSQDSSGLTLLHYAVLQENEQIIKLLIAKGADPFIRDNSGEHAFQQASLKIKQLLQ